MGNQDLSNPAEVIATPHPKAQVKAARASQRALPASAKYTLLQTIVIGGEPHDAGTVMVLTKAQAAPIFPDAIELVVE